MSEQHIRVDYLARVEGEGALKITVKDSQVVDLRLDIFEPPRFFEAFLRGRSFHEVVDIVARICGICPVAYQMSAAHALEKALAITPPPGVRSLRRLLYCGEWIESHALHVFLLHLPDFLGHESAVSMASDPALRPIVERGLRLKKIGNRLMTILGGREIHPVSVCVGGFYRAPAPSELRPLLPELEWGIEAAAQTLRWAAALEFPAFDGRYEFVSLFHPDEYPMNEGRIVSSWGLDIAMEDYEKHFRELQVPHSNALHSVRADTGTSYMVGPLARLHFNFERLQPEAKALACEVGICPPMHNPFASLLARGVEILHALEEAHAIIREYHGIGESCSAEVTARSGVGMHATEAPRGLLYHRYHVGEDGTILEAKIVPPTAQNLRRIEDDLRHYVPSILSLPLPDATLRCEQLVRSYDPCISCATHFLKLEIEHV